MWAATLALAAAALLVALEHASSAGGALPRRHASSIG